MKALFFNEHGSIENIKFGELPTPEISPDQVLVRVKACAINHLDLWVLRGWPQLKLNLPHIGGSDISGIIETVGEKVTAWKKGDRVSVNPGVLTGSDQWTNSGEESLSPNYKIIGESLPGGFAEFIAVPERNLFKLPDTIDFPEGAAPLLVGITSYRMLVKRAKLQAGETVLVIGAGGGVNSFSIQLAKHLGTRVIALTSSAEKTLKAKQLGAEEVINYKENSQWGKEVIKLTKGLGADVVIDNVGEKTFPQSLIACARGGRIVTVGNTSGFNLNFDNRYVFSKQISILGSTMGSSADFSEVMKLVCSGKIKPTIDKLLPLEKGAQAYQKLSTGEQFGKIILIP